MSFASLPFVGLVAAGVILYYLIPKQAQWVVLLLASMVFYLSGGVKSAVWLVLVAGLTWLAGLLLEKQNARPAPDKAAKTAVRSAKKRICAACLVLCFGLLYLMKYWNFTASALPSALGDKLPRWDFVVPLGLSYFIFQSVGYVIDVYRGKLSAQKNPLKYGLFVSFFPQMVQGRLQYDEFYALRDVSLDIMPGDFYGLVGLNGSGKSTLLKTIAGVYKPSKGKVTVNGTIAPLIELGAGFDMDLTARENIYLNGTVLGFSPKYLDEKFDEIVEFSELQNFLDVPLKNYSSGMVARIGFAIATITKPDILIADEVLAVGDFLFQQKCEKRMKELMAGGTTVILVSHSIEQIERMCSKVAWLSHGHLKMNGDTETVCNAYKAVQRGEA